MLLNPVTITDVCPSILYLLPCASLCSQMYVPQLSPNSDWLQVGRPGFDPRQRQRIFPLISASRPALGPTQPPVQWVLGALPPGVQRCRGVMLTTHPLLVPRSGKSRSYTSSHLKRQTINQFIVVMENCCFL
jgi:hypothetical protein